MTKKLGSSLETNNFQMINEKWYLYRTTDDILSPNQKCIAKGVDISNCTHDSPCTTNKGNPFYCLPAEHSGQAARLMPLSGPDGILCDANEKTSDKPYVINVVQNGDTTDYVCSNKTVDLGTYTCDLKSGCKQDSSSTMTAKECLESCNSGYKCNDDFTCSSCLISDDHPECKSGKCADKEICVDCGNNCSGNGKCYKSVNKKYCKCNPGFTGVHCQTKVCPPENPGTCGTYPGQDYCNKTSGCEYYPDIYTVPSSMGGFTYCQCKPTFMDNVWTVDCPDWQPNNSYFKNKDNTYWNSNVNQWGKGDDICKTNYGPTSYQNGDWHDCGKHGGQNYTSQVQCSAPKGSKQNMPWAWYQG